MDDRLKVIHYGLGPIGSQIAHVVAGRPGLDIVGAVDTDPAKTGLDLGRLAGLDRVLGVPVVSSLEAVLERTTADVVVHSTGSRLVEVRDQLMSLVRAGLNVVSTCEELSYPWAAHPTVAAELDAMAKSSAVSLLGTGVNPGFVMDTLALVLSGACQQISHVRIQRVVDTAERRVQLQRKTGAGVSIEEFQKRVRAGTIRHIGLPESCQMVAAGLGWTLDKVQDLIEPVIADHAVASEHIRVAAGQVAGVRQTARGIMSRKEVILLELRLELGARETFDAIQIDGTPPVNMVIADGIHGDQATAAIVANAIPVLVAARPGLLTMVDMPLVSCRA